MHAPNWSTVLALSLGTKKVTDLAEQAAERAGYTGLQPYLKSAFSTALAVGASAYVGRSARERLVLAAAVAGGAAVVHQQMEGGAPLQVSLPKRRGPAVRSL